jgi:tetratricopeptide (TPR) repeat protein
MSKKWYVLLVLVLFVFQGLVLNAADAPPKKVAKLMAKAEKAMKKNKVEKAMESLNKALELAPEYGPVYFTIGRIQMSQKKFDEAIANMDKAMKFDSENTQIKQYFAKTMFQLAREALSQKLIKKANDYFLKIVTIPGIDTIEQKLYMETLYQLGQNYFSLRDLKKSNEYWEKVLTIPNLDTIDAKLVFQVTYKVGINYYNLKDFAQSNVYFGKLVALPAAQTDNPKIFATAHYLMGLNASQLKESEKSNQYLKKFLELNADPAVNNPQLGPLANFIVGSNEMAALDKDVQKVREDKNVKEKKEKIAELAKGKASIIDYLNKAIAGQPNLEPAYMHIGNYYYYQGDKVKAIEAYKTLIVKFPASPDLATYKNFLTDLEKPEPKKNKRRKR